MSAPSPLSPPPRLHLVDGTYELFRAHHSKRPGHRTPAGEERKAVVGLVSSLLMLVHDETESVTHLAVAFDNPIHSFRNGLFAGYKSDEGVEPELRTQFDAAEEAVRAMGAVVWSMADFEADDALATASVKYRDAFSQIRLLTPDKDLAQCLSGTHVIQVDRMREKTVDEASFREKRGFSPQSIPDFLGLVGDTADGIPGLPGFGEKSTATLLATYPSLESFPLEREAWRRLKLRGADTLFATFLAERPNALLYRQLATLRQDVPLAEDAEALAYRGPSRSDFTAWTQRLGLSDSLAARVKRWRVDSKSSHSRG